MKALKKYLESIDEDTAKIGVKLLKEGNYSEKELIEFLRDDINKVLNYTYISICVYLMKERGFKNVKTRITA